MKSITEKMKPLMKYRASFNNLDSWALAPIGKDTPVVAGYYDPKDKVLALVTDAKKQSFTMLPKLNEDGSPQIINKMGSHSDPHNFKEERTKIEKYMEHYMSHPEDIAWFLENFVENNFEFQHAPEEAKSDLITSSNLIINPNSID